jgi:uncharacterized protein YkwD
MRSSTFLTVLGAGLAIASPLIKKAIVTEIDTDVVYVYVTETAPTATTSSSVYTTVITLEVIPTQASPSTSSTTSTSFTPTSTSTSSTPTTTSTPPSPTTVAPSTTTTPPPAPPTTEAPAAAATTAAPAAASSAAPSPAPIGDSGNGLPTGTDFESKVIYHHNIHRQNHSADNAVYDSTIAGYAETVANSCVYAHNLSPGGGGYGQNIAAYGATGDENLGAAESVAMAITDMWYNGEVNSFLPSYYGQANPDPNTFENWGHFSQVVWNGTTSIGCASVLCPDGSIFQGLQTWFTVCNYYPAGNMGGDYGANIFEPTGADTVTV